MTGERNADSRLTYDVDLHYVGGKVEESRLQLQKLMNERAAAGWRLVNAAPMPVSGGIAAIAAANFWLISEREF